MFAIWTSGEFAARPEFRHLVLCCIASIVAAYSIGFAMHPLLMTVARGRRLLGVAFCLAVMMCPLLVPAQKVVIRALLSVLFADLAFKLVDYARCYGRLDNLNSGGFREYSRFLIPFPTLLVVFQQWQRLKLQTADRSGQIPRIIVGGSMFVLCALLLSKVCQVSDLRDNFVLQHVAHLLIFVVAIESLSQSLCGVERILGFQTSPIVRFAFVSRTVGEFWQRYNSRVHSWLAANVFADVAKKRSPVAAIWMTFLISGIQHELGFGIATSRFDGYQFAFFTLQAPGVLLTHALDRRLVQFGIAGKAVSHIVTILWFVVTSPLFFHGVNRVFKYAC